VKSDVIYALRWDQEKWGNMGRKPAKKLLRNEHMHAPEATAPTHTTRKANTITLTLHLEHNKSTDTGYKSGISRCEERTVINDWPSGLFLTASSSLSAPYTCTICVPSTLNLLLTNYPGLHTNILYMWP
jgi:hypothetical protein